MRIPLRNDFSVAQSCFGCGPENKTGLGLSFEAVDSTVEATFTLGQEFSGAPMFVHGGVVMTLLDEAMAWSTIAIRRRFAVTRDFSARFQVPVLIGGTYTVHAVPGPLVEGDRTLTVTGEIRAADGTVCATAEGTYWVMTAEETAAATGMPQLSEEFLRYEFPVPESAS